MKTGKILFLSDGRDTRTGYMTVVRNLAKKFVNNGFEIGIAALVRYKKVNDKPLMDCQEWYPDKKDIHSIRASVHKAITEFDPDIIISVADAWNVAFVVSEIKQSRANYIMYCPSDGDVYPEYVLIGNVIDMKKVLEVPDILIAYNKFGAKALSNIREPDHIIHHGVDIDVFKPRNITPDQKAKLFSCKPTDTVYFAAGKNMTRKGWDKLFEAWHRFSKKRSDVVLYIHTEPQGNPRTWDLNLLSISMGIGKTIRSRANAYEELSDLDIAFMYSACDIYVMLPRAEGFGLPYLEAMASAKPIIYTDYGGHTSYVTGAGLPVKVESYTKDRGTFWRLAIASDKHASQCMDKLYRDLSLRNNLGNVGLRIAQEHTWDNITNKWINIINDINVYEYRSVVL